MFACRTAGNDDVYIGRPGEQDSKSITPFSPAKDQAYGWSPEGQHVLFLSNRSNTGGSFLYVMGTAGSGVQLAIII